MDIATVSGAAGAAGLTSVLFWKLLFRSIDSKQDRCVCEEKHKAVEEMNKTVKNIDLKLDGAIIAITRLESKIESNPKGERQ